MADRSNHFGARRVQIHVKVTQSREAGRLRWPRRAAVLLAVTAGALGPLLIAAVGAPAASAGIRLLPKGIRGGAAVGPAYQRCSAPSNQVLRGVPWTQQRLAPQRVWGMTTGRGVIVGVVDTGVDASVPQLVGRVLPGVDVINGTGPGNTDCYGHGTFVAGLIAAAPTAGTGLAGIAPGVLILPVRQANDTNDGTASSLARSIIAAVNGGAKVINVSATSFFPTEELRVSVAFAQARDVVIVASASNEAQQGNPTAYPAAYPGVIAVGAVGHDDKRTGFSEVGDYLDLMAPGVDIVSLSRGGVGHRSDNGTSYAAPFVAGVAALVRASHPKLTAAQVKRRLEVTADHPASQLPDPQMGWGVVNPYNAVTAVLPQESGMGVVAVAPPRMSKVARIIPDTTTRDFATSFAAGAAFLMVGMGLLGYLLPRGQRRGWLPADGPEPVFPDPDDDVPPQRAPPRQRARA
jgi:type VII secretion-associated serine protease mycosin